MSFNVGQSQFISFGNVPLSHPVETDRVRIAPNLIDSIGVRSGANPNIFGVDAANLGYSLVGRDTLTFSWFWDSVSTNIVPMPVSFSWTVFQFYNQLKSYMGYPVAFGGQVGRMTAVSDVRVTEAPAPALHRELSYLDVITFDVSFVGITFRPSGGGVVIPKSSAGLYFITNPGGTDSDGVTQNNTGLSIPASRAFIEGEETFGAVVQEIFHVPPVGENIVYAFTQNNLDLTLSAEAEQYGTEWVTLRVTGDFQPYLRLTYAWMGGYVWNVQDAASVNPTQWDITLSRTYLPASRL